MDCDRHKSSELNSSFNNDDAKYVSGISTILVAAIQEAKDRISQIEYIFCSQLYPNFQSKSKSLQKIYSDASKAAEDAWKGKVKDLQDKIDKLQQANHFPSVEKLQHVNSDDKELCQKLQQKSKEVDEGMKLHKKLLELLQEKENVIFDKDKLLKKAEEKTSELFVNLNNLGNKVEKLQMELNQKTEEVQKERELQENFCLKIESLTSRMVKGEELLNHSEKERRQLKDKTASLENNIAELQKALKEKTNEVEKEKKMHEKLLQQIDSNAFETLKSGQDFAKLEKEKEVFVARVKGLEEKIDMLQMELKRSRTELAEGMELHGNLLREIQRKNSEMTYERDRRKDIVTAYKKLKSQHNYLCSKFGLTTENAPCGSKLEAEGSSMQQDDVEKKVVCASSTVCEVAKENFNQENLESDLGVRPSEKSSSVSPLGSSISPKRQTITKSCSPFGKKRPVSYWRNTRSHQNQGGPDPHDDFLDTPLENIRGNLKKVMKEEDDNLPSAMEKNMGFNSSDDETQDINVDTGPKKPQIPLPKATATNYKYIEPVRKKADRENLKGIECKQCKKFYDSVLPKDGSKETGGSNTNLRCEHHDGVSRHRYRYAPPLTPEGFWNIGFESEM